MSKTSAMKNASRAPPPCESGGDRNIHYENEIDILFSNGSFHRHKLGILSPLEASSEFGSKIGPNYVLTLSTRWSERKKRFVVSVCCEKHRYAGQGLRRTISYNFECVIERHFFWIRNNIKHNKNNIDSKPQEEAKNEEDRMKKKIFSVSDWLKTPAGMEKSLSILYDVILNASPTIANQLEIGSLEHDLASKVLLEKLLSKNVKKLEFCDFEDESKKQRIFGLYCKLLQHSTSLEEVCCFNFVSFNHELGKQLFKSIASPPSLPQLLLSSRDEQKESHYQAPLKSFVFPNGRYNATCHKGEKKRRPDDKITIPLSTIEPLLVSLADQRMEALDDGNGNVVRKAKPSFNCLDLGGNTPSNDAMVALATALPKLGLETLKLRDTDLQEEALLQFAKSLHQDKTLKKLDLSSNTVSLEVLKELCSALESNKTLECLFLEYCDLELDHAEYLAEHLPKFVGLRHLHLDGNTFTWKPLRDDEIVSIGSTCLVRALEKNQVLLTLELGEFGNLLWGTMYVGCTTLPHRAVLSRADARNLEEWLKRNKRLYEEMLNSKEQENIVNVARILLSKMS